MPWIRPLTAGDRDRSQISPCEMCGEQGGNRTGYSPNTSVFPCQYHSANAPYSPLSVSFRQRSILSPVSIIPPTLHTHLHRQVALTRRTNERILGTFRQSASNGQRNSVSQCLEGHATAHISISGRPASALRGIFRTKAEKRRAQRSVETRRQTMVTVSSCEGLGAD